MGQLDKQLNERLYHYRKLAGYTQASVAQELGMKKNTYARMEKYGSPKPELLIKLASLFNVSTNILLYGHEIDAKQPDIIRAQEPIMPYFPSNDVKLTATEKSCLLTMRGLSKDQKQDVIDLINKFYQENKTSKGDT